MKKIFAIAFLFISALGQINSQIRLLTIAERSEFKSTSNYNDVMTFIDQLKKTSKFIRVESIAKSVEGRDVPLLIIGNPLPKSPEQMSKDNRIVIYVQANIHAGEVEGKEAVLMFARDLLSDKNPDLLKNIVFLLCPNFTFLLVQPTANASTPSKIMTGTRRDIGTSGKQSPVVGLQSSAGVSLLTTETDD